MYAEIRLHGRKAALLIVLAAISLAGCQVLPFGRSQLNWVVSLDQQQGALSATLGFQKTAGERDFSAAQGQVGVMALLDSRDQRLEQIWYPEVGDLIGTHNTTDMEETELVAEWQQPLPPGDYRLVWGSQLFGYQEIKFMMEDSSIESRSEKRVDVVEDLLAYDQALPLVNLAINDLAIRLGGQPDQIRIRSVAYPFNGPQGSEAEGYRVKLYAVGLQMERDFYLYQAANNYIRLINES